MVDVSIIIVNYNTAHFTLECIASILRQNLTHTIEVIVVDNHSVDGSAAQIKAAFSNVKVIENSTNLGFSAGNNRGIDVAEGRYLLLLNSDTEFIDNGLDRLINLMDDQTELMLVACRLLNSDGTIQPSLLRFPNLFSVVLDSFVLTSLLLRIPVLKRLTLWETDYNTAREADQISGAFMLMRRSLIEKMGNLDERFFMYYDDVDFCLRAKNAGHKVVFRPEVQIIHHGGKTFQLHKVAATEQRLISKVLFFKKYHPQLLWPVKFLVSMELSIRTAIAFVLSFRELNAQRELISSFKKGITTLREI